MAMHAATSGHQQRSEATRQGILDAAVALYHSHGVEQTTVSAVIAASGVGRTTFYRHFDDQDDVLASALRRDFERLLSEFEAQRFEHAALDAQIIEDIVWFVRQLSTRPALSLLFGDQKSRLFERIHATLNEFRHAGMICARPTFERAVREGRLRQGVTLAAYIDWVTFVVTSLEIVAAPFARDDFALRDALRLFLVPSLIKDA